MNATLDDSLGEIHISVIHDLALKLGYKLADLDTITAISGTPDKISVTRVLILAGGPLVMTDPRGHRHLVEYVEYFRVVRHTAEEVDNNG